MLISLSFIVTIILNTQYAFAYPLKVVPTLFSNRFVFLFVYFTSSLSTLFKALKGGGGGVDTGQYFSKD